MSGKQNGNVVVAVMYATVVSAWSSVLFCILGDHCKIGHAVRWKEIMEPWNTVKVFFKDPTADIILVALGFFVFVSMFFYDEYKRCENNWSTHEGGLRPNGEQKNKEKDGDTQDKKEQDAVEPTVTLFVGWLCFLLHVTFLKVPQLAALLWLLGLIVISCGLPWSCPKNKRYIVENWLIGISLAIFIFFTATGICCLALVLILVLVFRLLPIEKLFTKIKRLLNVVNPWKGGEK